MSLNVPVTVWAPTDGNSELGQSTSANIDTLSGRDIVTLSGVSLIIAAGSQTTIPQTVWAENDAL